MEVKQDTPEKKRLDMSKSELACVYAALILADVDVAITGQKIETILNAAGVEVVPFFPGLFAKALESCCIKDLINNVGLSAVPVATVDGTASSDDATPAAEEKVAEKEEDSEESDEGLGIFDLF